MSNLTASVLVYDDNGDAVWFKPGDTVPGWAAKQITNPAAWDGDAPEADAAARYPEGEPSEDWKGDELKAYAEDKQVDLAGATKKADMVAAIQAAAQA